jgi:hypothetical protein
LEYPGLLEYPDMIADFPGGNDPGEAVTGPIIKIKIRVIASTVKTGMTFILTPLNNRASFHDS